MPINQYEAAVITTAIGALPKIIDLIRGDHVVAHPTEPPPTDAEVIAAFQSWAMSSLVIDDAWRAAHSVG